MTHDPLTHRQLCLPPGAGCWTFFEIFGWLIFKKLLLINSLKFRPTFSHRRPSQQQLSSYFTYLLDRWFASLKSKSYSRLQTYKMCPCAFLYHSFSVTVCKTVRPMLSDRCPVCLSVLSGCDVGALWPHGWMDQDDT